MGIEIISVKVVGVCSKHATESNPAPKDKNGRQYDDEDIACIDCMI
jgi:hypothetical protein